MIILLKQYPRHDLWQSNLSILPEAQTKLIAVFDNPVMDGFYKVSVSLSLENLTIW